MPSEKTKELIEKGRAFLQFDYEEEGEATDQELKLPQPKLVKPKASNQTIALPRNFSDLQMSNDIISVIGNRESHRVYTDEKLTLLELSFLLWATQGVKSIRGNQYATLRTVPSGGARHEFETYLLVNHVEGIDPGKYHYLPLEHQLEWIGTVDNWKADIDASLAGQVWAASANVVFYWSVIPYRSEWRYSYAAHRIILVDIGHVCQNLYIAAQALGLGTCAIGAFIKNTCDHLFQLDGKEEFTILAAPVGTVSVQDKGKELAFYSFLKEDTKE